MTQEIGLPPRSVLLITSRDAEGVNGSARKVNRRRGFDIKDETITPRKTRWENLAARLAGNILHGPVLNAVTLRPGKLILSR